MLLRPRPPRRARAVLALVAVTVATVACAAAPPGPPPTSLGVLQDRPVPALSFVDAAGRATTLAAFRGKVLVLVPFLTLCQEVCPLTTANLLVVERTLQADHVAGKVAIVEYSVDPGRDTPARLAAYARRTGATWPLLTGSAAQVAAADQFFYVYVQRVPEGTPPGIDWMTGKPLTYDVNHSDGFFLIDRRGHERFATEATPSVPGHRIPAALRSMLDAQGLQNLYAPNGQTWTVPQLLDALGWLLGRHLAPLG